MSVFDTSGAMSGERPRIVVLSGPTATVANSAPLVTSNLARRRHGLAPLTDPWGQPLRYDVLRPQRLARTVTVYVEQHSTHPLESDSAELYGPPDGYLDGQGTFWKERQQASDVPVYEIELRPEDGLIPLPYMARQRDGRAWEGDCTDPGEVADRCRQPFYPDAARIFEEIDRLGVDQTGRGNLLSSQADFDFVRVLPSAGYRRGLDGDRRTDIGEGDIEPEELWHDYFPYRPAHLRREPPRPLLARLTNRVQAAVSAAPYRGALWLEGSPFLEETIYWLNLLIDTRAPIVGCASPDWPHGVLAASGDRHLVDAVRYINSRIWAGEDGNDRVGAVVVQSEQVFSAREAQKADARPGGYVATGGHGGVVASTGEPGPPVLSFLPTRLHTYRSAVRLTQLPAVVGGVRGPEPAMVSVAVRDEAGDLLPDAIPHVSIVKHARFLAEDVAASAATEPEIVARLRRNLDRFPLAGFVAEGGVPYGSMSQSADAALRLATFSGMPVVRVGRGNADGYVAQERVRHGIAGGNLTATKARMLLMACLLRFGSLPPAEDPQHPTDTEVGAIEEALASFQRIFDTH